MAKQIIVPFADSGDKTDIPNAVQPTGDVSYTEGYGFDYSRIPGSSALAKDFPRVKHNQLMYDITSNIQQYQQFGAPEWYAGLYAQYARVRHVGQVWVNTVVGNTTEPGSSGTWVASNIPASARKNNLIATTDPTTGDDSADGYEPLSQWINTTTTEVFVCISATVGAAVWEKGTLTADELGNMALINGSTVGQNLAQVTNPSAIRFIRVNADNTVSLLDAAAFLTAVGGGGSGATVDQTFAGLVGLSAKVATFNMLTSKASVSSNTVGAGQVTTNAIVAIGETVQLTASTVPPTGFTIPSAATPTVYFPLYDASSNLPVNAALALTRVSATNVSLNVYNGAAALAIGTLRFNSAYPGA